MDLAEFLLARLAEDEQVAKAAISRLGEGRWRGEGPQVRDDLDRLIVKHSWPNEIEHIARHDPARVMAEVESKRAIIPLHTVWHECSTYDRNGEIDNCTYVLEGEACSTMQLLALPYANHPECHPSWLPPVRTQAEH